jgi:hypothetical protein
MSGAERSRTAGRAAAGARLACPAHPVRTVSGAPARSRPPPISRPMSAPKAVAGANARGTPAP